MTSVYMALFEIQFELFLQICAPSKTGKLCDQAPALLQLTTEIHHHMPSQNECLPPVCKSHGTNTGN